MTDTNPAHTRAWLLRTLDDAGKRITKARDAGAENPELSWTDADDVAITVKAHGQGFTLNAAPKTGAALEPLTFPIGWTKET